MRFHVVRDPQARPAAYRKFIGAAARNRTVTFGFLAVAASGLVITCLLYTSPSPRDGLLSRMPSSA